MRSRLLWAAVVVAGLMISSVPVIAHGEPSQPANSAAASASDQVLLDGMEGTPSRPENYRPAARRAILRDLAAARAESAPVDGFRLSSRDLAMVPVGQRPYDSTVVQPRDGWGLVDADGVRMFSWPGDPTLWNHPVAQAQYAILNLDSYRLTDDPVYLHRAERNAERLIDRRVESAGAWYYPYDFDFAPSGDTTEILRAPWFSAMAQGQALTVFVRLSEVTDDDRWRQAADATVISLEQKAEGSAPFTSWVDDRSLLWLDEYPRYPAELGERVLNGHIFALYGLYDYWRVTGDARARNLFRGGLATLEATVMTEFRRPGWLSIYSLRHAQHTASYHQVHQSQFLMLWRLTGDPRWLNAASAFRDDYPRPAEAGTLRISPRTTVIYRLDAQKAISQRRSVKFTRFTQAPFNLRQRAKGGPIVYRVSEGPYRGWWFPEGFGVAWGLGALALQEHTPQPALKFRGGTTFTAYRLDRSGAVAGYKTMTIPAGRDSKAPSSGTAIVQGRPAHLVTAGPLAGYWVPAQSKVYLG